MCGCVPELEGTTKRGCAHPTGNPAGNRMEREREIMKDERRARARLSMYRKMRPNEDVFGLEGDDLVDPLREGGYSSVDTCGKVRD